MNSRFFFAISFIVFLTGCENERTIDQVQIIESIGYDQHEDEIKGTAIYPTFTEKGQTKLNILTTKSASYDDILPRLNTKAAHPIEIGQLRLVLFGKMFAEQGLNPVIESLNRDPIVGSRMQLGIAEHTAENILISGKNTNLPFHLSDKINQNIQDGNLPKMNLHLFLENFYNKGRDPYLPYFTIEEGLAHINGLALFKNGKYINHINLNQSFIVKMLIDGAKNGRYHIKINENKKDGFISLKNLDAKAHYTISQIDQVPNISIDLTMNTQIKDVPPWLNVTAKKDILKMENLMNKHFKEEVQQLISLFQEYQVDPIGFGDMVRAKSRKWNYSRFQDMYPNLKTTVNTKVNIIQTGVGE
ncbi:Ger(x)C family spore germination protein [Bacillus sp. 22-7]|uniref:Ger(x)C family spore germination protein n=1 Tax=Bacillus sp. 22-7 TaxID=2709707 RepID=UPI0013D32A05|nr:Ger(x)C family spore germination protein [Bacillus sp. 22-7]